MRIHGIRQTDLPALHMRRSLATRWEISLPKILPRRRGKAYLSTMTELLEHAVDSVRALPPEVQDELARLLLQVAGEEQPVILLTAEERADLAEADAEIARGGFATDQEIRTMLAKRPL
jgi:hypothetical protein